MYEQISPQNTQSQHPRLRPAVGDQITALTGYKFRIVIGNQYRTGMDSIGWHADNEKSMGYEPAIASVSLGSCRKFQIKPRNGKPTDFWLEHGSLLVMHPGCQSTHLHQVPNGTKKSGNAYQLSSLQLFT
ncbi:alpha-ketoglutarate-dependent dioxygenase AlkB [Nostoc sp. LEGE 12450]|uniref:alpha-ketoglutarate-dependent dioxygenase AlkB n=1 Tax=Nostoc sp. LEGE 12450 TaxID=1828643 RepID=UPI001D154F81|nr:alpha-ketoglutarate-dependent dioxygenase AlkB [Nostoc sp. LEGE 12450]